MEALRASGRMMFFVAMGLAVAACGSKAPPEEEEGGDALMLSDVTVLARAGSTWNAGATSVSANVVHASSQVTQYFTRATSDCLVYAGVLNWVSDKGLSPLTLTSSRQKATASWTGTRYNITGLKAGAAFNTSDTLTVQASAGATESVQAPAAVNAATVLGTPSGLSTEFRAPDGGFDYFYVFMQDTGLGPGQSGVMCFIKHDDMKLSGGQRTAPLFSAAIQAEMTRRSMTPKTIWAAIYRWKDSSKFFPGAARTVPVQAGRMFQVSAQNLK